MGHDALPRRYDRGPRRRFTPACKCQAVQSLNSWQRSEAEIAREFGIPRNRLYSGIANAFSGGKVGPISRKIAFGCPARQGGEEKGLLPEAAPIL